MSSGGGGTTGREWLLLGLSVTLSLVGALALIRWLAPGLLGVAPGLGVVQLSEEVVPFYENVFRQGDAASEKFILNDPVTLVRAQPFRRDEVTGPTDVLGFRNHGVPNRADVVAIGDSQTFGINVPIDYNWPSRLGALLGAPEVRVYSMATGGWGAVQYLDMFDKALSFDPAVVVVAFYSGNDAAESFRVAYAIEHWASLRVVPDLDPGERPPRPPPKDEDRFLARLGDGRPMVFTPGRRLTSNRDHPVVDAGWGIMAEVSRRIGEQARRAGVRVVFTVIPTKELVHAPLVRWGLGGAPADYSELVAVEARRIAILRGELAGIGGASYVDLLEPLRQAARREGGTYPDADDGHPLALGYQEIARALHPEVSRTWQRRVRRRRAPPRGAGRPAAGRT